MGGAACRVCNARITVAALLSLAGRGGLYLGGSPAPVMREESGPLTVPLRTVRDGMARWKARQSSRHIKRFAWRRCTALPIRKISLQNSFDLW